MKPYERSGKMMRLLLCNTPPPPELRQSSAPKFPITNFVRFLKPTEVLTPALLSVSLFLGIYSMCPLDAISLEVRTPQEELKCRDEEMYADNKSTAEEVTNENIVEEAWQVVNDTYFDTGRHRWSPDSWLKKKEDISSTSIQSRAKAHEIIRRMLASLGDRYTRFLSPFEFSKMARYDMTGIGINLREIPDDRGALKLKVLGLILDGPAHSAGVRQGDELLSINGMDVQGKSAFEASSMLQGPGETFINITVKHGDCGPIETISIQRQQSIAKSPVFYQLEQVKNSSSSVGYVRVKEFNALATKDLITAMRRLQDMGASYFVLDLRDNLGGLVQAGIETAKLFLDKGETVTYTVGRDHLSIKTVADNSPVFSAPIIVLVNKNTASASEIVATALHDNCRAVLVGERTYGKGLIQSVFELDDGSGMVVTVGKYVTPKHMDINGNGVDPDFRNPPGWNEVIRYLNKCHKPREG